MWVGDTVYFISDRDGVANVWSYDTAGEAARAGHDSSPTSTSRRSTPAAARSCSSRRARSTSSIRRRAARKVVTITRGRRLPVDDAAVGGRHRRAWRTSRSRRPASASWSKRAARSSRSRPRRATCATSRTRAASAERAPAWSPDGKFDLVLQRPVRRVQAGASSRRTASTPPREIALAEAEPSTTRRRGRPTRRSCSTPTRTCSVWVMDVASGKAKIVGNDPWMVPQRTLHPVWSPDSQWVAFAEPPATRSTARSSSPTSRRARRSR